MKENVIEIKSFKFANLSSSPSLSSGSTVGSGVGVGVGSGVGSGVGTGVGVATFSTTWVRSTAGGSGELSDAEGTQNIPTKKMPKPTNTFIFFLITIFFSNSFSIFTVNELFAKSITEKALHFFFLYMATNL